MKKIALLFTLLSLIFSSASATVESPRRLLLAPGTLSATSATMVWDKPEQYAAILRYHLLLNGKQVAVSDRCNWRFNELKPGTTYRCQVQSEDQKGNLSVACPAVSFTTRRQGKVLDVTQFGAKGDDNTLNTVFIQKAIDACPVDGIVLIPKGVFVTGALFLKSHMTLEIAKGGVLKGSTNQADYLPYINNRFEGWEMKTYASLLNAGTMNHEGGFSVEQLSIRGEGTLQGGGTPLATQMIQKDGLRSRGRLILLMNCKDVEIQGLHIQNSPCWTIHYLYSKGITCHDLDIVSTAHNGDGLDPDSSDDSYILNCTFSTGDDCIAIKSGKNPEGFLLAKPTRNVVISNCNFTKGHGISIGSEMSGGVSDVLVQDCKAGNLLNGMQIKGTRERGGYVRNVTVADCQLLKITILTQLNYNNDGAAAPEAPTFENFRFSNLDLSAAKAGQPVMIINGFKEVLHHLRNLVFDNITLPDNAQIVMTDAEKVKFTNVKTQSGAQPIYNITTSSEVIH